MINIEELKEEDKGRAVTYESSTGYKEFGILSSWHKNYIFVKFKLPGDGMACYPENVTFDFPIGD